MAAQDGVDNIRGQQGIPNSIDPNFHADQLQLVVDELQETNRPLLVTNTDGTRIGEIFQDETYGLVLRAKDTLDSKLPVTLVGSTVVVGGETTMVKFNGAQEGNFLQLGAPLDLDGSLVFPLTATPLNVEVYSEEATSNVDVSVATSYGTLISHVTTNTYQPESSVANIQFRAENTSNQARELTYYITVNGAPPTVDDEFTATVPAKSSGNNGVLIISTNDSSTSLVDIGDTVTCEMKSNGSGVTITGSVLATKLKLTQNTSIQDTIVDVSSLPPSGSCEYSFSPLEIQPFILTATYQVVDGTFWSTGATPVGVSLNPTEGVITVNRVARWMVGLERVYHSHDRSPSVPLKVHIKVQADLGAGWVDTEFSRSSIVPAATANDEPSVLAFTTNFILDVPLADTKFRILVAGDENGVDNPDLHLHKLKVVAHVAGNIPE